MLEPRHPKEGTQAAIVLEMLIAAKGCEVKGIKLAYHAHSMAVHSVISTLRIDYGWSIKNRIEYKKIEGHSVCYSFYSLATDQLDNLVA